MAEPTVSPYANTRPDNKFISQNATANDVLAKEKLKQETLKKLSDNKRKVDQLKSDMSAMKNSGVYVAAEKMAYFKKLIDEKNQAQKYAPYGNNSVTVADAKLIAGWLDSYKYYVDLWNKDTAKVQDFQKQIDTLAAERIKLLAFARRGYKEGTGGPVGVGTTGGATSGNQSSKNKPSTENTAPAPDANPLAYVYNAPMVKTAYFNPFGVQAHTVTDRKVLQAPGFTDANKAWKGVTPSKGTIQMSKTFASMKWTNPTNKNSKGVSTQPVGFRFLYNPTDVSMAWGIVDAFSPEYAQSASNMMTGIAVGLMKGTIAFSLLLNRIDDMNHLNSNGLITSVDTSQIPAELDPAERNAWYKRLYANSNPYPTTVPIEDQQMIYKRGTMYDLEYLFKTMGGYNSTYTSGLNGETADKGWLSPIPMELHLGAGMRYLIRVSQLDVKHIMFNERMVPILSTVNVVCTRYYDSPAAYDTSYYSPEAIDETKTYEKVTP